MCEGEMSSEAFKSAIVLETSVYKNYNQPLLIRIDGVFKNMKLHSVNLPEGVQVSLPDEAHRVLTQYDS